MRIVGFGSCLRHPGFPHTHARDAPHGPEDTLDPGALLQRVEVADDRGREGDDRARPEPLERPAEDQLPHRLATARVQASGWLIKEQKPWIPYHTHGKVELATHPAGVC